MGDELTELYGRSSSDGDRLKLWALEDAYGPHVVLDDALRITAWSPGAESLVDGLSLGVAAPRVLCGDGVKRPIAEAMAEGRPVHGMVARPTPDGRLRFVQVNATPIVREGVRVGWLLVLDQAPFEAEGDDAPVNFHGLWTRSPVMKVLFDDLERVARREVTVLVRGETGTGKELVARAIHECSKRSQGPFRAINCAALPPHLLESELFGHVRGAFTGAVRDNPGHFRLASGGTLFLDEVAELSLDLQAKLLRALQERTVIPVGGREPVPVDVRIVSATHRGLRSAVQEGSFRADLMYRLRVVPLYLPPLRARTEDLPLLVRLFLDRLADEDRRIQHVAPAAMRRLEEYTWSGNVRELQNVMEYAFAMGEGPVLKEGELPPELRGEAPLDELAVNVPESIEAGAASSEERRIRLALERASGHRERAARILGISRSTLWRRMRALGILEDDEDGGAQG